MAENIQPKCRCARCQIRSFTGPVMLIVVGVIFLCGEYTPYGFVTLWPVLLVVAGVLLLAQYGASREGHTTAPTQQDAALQLRESGGLHGSPGAGPETPDSTSPGSGRS
jgi:hypothetical protein